MTANPINVVDYDAWKRGYVPPTEHQLIDDLAFRGARVVAASLGAQTGWYLVVKGPLLWDEDFELVEMALSRMRKRNQELVRALEVIGNVARMIAATEHDPDNARPSEDA